MKKYLLLFLFTILISMNNSKGEKNKEFFDNLIIRLEKNDPELTKIDLFDIAEGHNQTIIEDAVTIKIINALKKNTKLKILDLSELDLGRGVLEPIANILKENNTLEVLNLSYNSSFIIYNAWWQNFIDAISINKGLKKLYLRDDQIDSKQVQEIANALKVNQFLQKIDLSENHISDDGVKALSEALKVNKTLKEIDLSKNRISDDGVKALSEALKENKTLKEIDLSYNDHISLYAISDLLNNIKYTNSTIIDLNVDNNRDEILGKLENFLTKNKEKRNRAGGQRTDTGGRSSYTGGPRGTTGGRSSYTGGPRGTTGGRGSYTGGPRGTAGGRSSYTGGPRGTAGGRSSYTGGPRGTTGGRSSYTGGSRGTAGGRSSYTGGPRGTAGGRSSYTGGPRVDTERQEKYNIILKRPFIKFVWQKMCEHKFNRTIIKSIINTKKTVEFKKNMDLKNLKENIDFLINDKLSSNREKYNKEKLIKDITLSKSISMRKLSRYFHPDKNEKFFELNNKKFENPFFNLFFKCQVTLNALDSEKEEYFFANKFIINIIRWVAEFQSTL